MAANGGGLPKWLLNCKETLMKTREWATFAESLHEVIQQQLTESHVQSFTDLTEAERTLFLERATKSIQDGKAHAELFAEVSKTLDHNMNADVTKQLLEETPIATKTDLILDSAEEGIISLLRRWPDMKSKLNVCLNQPLPPTLRQLAWRLFLENSKVRKEYIDILSKNARAAISPQDLDISKKCEQLLMTEPTFSQLNGSVGAFYAMKAVLSYHHTVTNVKARLPDIDYMLVVPLVQVMSANISRKEPAKTNVVALLVEEYFTLMRNRPQYVANTGSKEDAESLKTFIEGVSKTLQNISPDITRAVVEHSKPSEETIVATETGALALLVEGLTTLSQAMLRSMFIGYVNMEVVLFIWDQYLIGMETAGYQDNIFSAAVCCLYLLLEEKLIKCESISAMETVLKDEAPKLKTAQFQFMMRKHFEKDLKAALSNDDQAILPILNPTKDRSWQQWDKDAFSGVSQTEERRRAREAREQERQRQLQLMKDEENRRKQNKERERRDDYEKFLQQTSIEHQRNEEARLEMERMLEEERKRRMENERQAAEQIEQLRREMDDLKRNALKSANPSLKSHISDISAYLMQPAPTPATQTPPYTPPRSSRMKTPSTRKTPDVQTKQVVVDFLRKVGHGIQKVGHGEGAEKQDLNAVTKKYMQQHKEDMKAAETCMESHIRQK